MTLSVVPLTGIRFEPNSCSPGRLDVTVPPDWPVVPLHTLRNGDSRGTLVAYRRQVVPERSKRSDMDHWRAAVATHGYIIAGIGTVGRFLTFPAPRGEPFAFFFSRRRPHIRAAICRLPSGRNCDLPRLRLRSTGDRPSLEAVAVHDLTGNCAERRQAAVC